MVDRNNILSRETSLLTAQFHPSLRAIPFKNIGGGGCKFMYSVMFITEGAVFSYNIIIADMIPSR